MSKYTFDPAITLHIDKYLKPLFLGREIDISALVSSFSAFDPLVHPNSATGTLNLDAFAFALNRLPPEIYTVSKILFFQSTDDIAACGFDITKWRRTKSASRRRLTFINPTNNTLATIISSDSDIHDLVNSLISFYIERQKLGNLAKKYFEQLNVTQDIASLKLERSISKHLLQILGKNWQEMLNAFAINNPLTIKLYGSLPPKYYQNAVSWNNNLVNHSYLLNFTDSPVYIVSSNSNNIINLASGYVHKKQNLIVDYASKHSPDLFNQWLELKKSANTLRLNDFLYYLAPLFFQSDPVIQQEKSALENQLGLKTIESTDAFQAKSQIIPISAIARSSNIDSNLDLRSLDTLAGSNAFILNIEYPLGQAAYYLLTQLLATFTQIKSFYIVGKAAILRGNIGDIQIPGYVYDENQNREYKVNNVFNQRLNLQNFISNIFYHQKEVCVYATHLESKYTIEQYLSEHINIIEMENGPYLQAVFEKFPDSAVIGPDNITDLSAVPLELGIINYASDNPLIQNLTQEKSSILGIESGYISSLAIVQRIIDNEIKRLSG